jgi:hypothetical protein
LIGLRISASTPWLDQVDHHRRLRVGVAVRVGVEEGYARGFRRRVHHALGHALEERVGERRHVVADLDRLALGESRCPDEHGCDSRSTRPHEFTTIHDETPWLLPLLNGTRQRFLETEIGLPRRRSDVRHGCIWAIIGRDRQVGFGTGKPIELLADAGPHTPVRETPDLSRRCFAHRHSQSCAGAVGVADTPWPIL